MAEIISNYVTSTFFASSKFLATPFERNFVPTKFVDFASNNWWVAIGMVTAYLIFITAGSKFMKDVKAFDIRLPLAGWNALLCLFSFIGMCRTMPYLLASIMTKPFEETVCANPMDTWGVETTGFWVMLFIFSKIPELIDTVFIVLRKKATHLFALVSPCYCVVVLLECIFHNGRIWIIFRCNELFCPCANVWILLLTSFELLS
jgi:hypothetical protein